MSSSGLAAIKVSTRIYAGFSITLALLAAVAAIGFFGLQSAGGGFAEFARVNANSQRVASVERDSVDLRRAVLTFVDRGDDASVQAAKDLQGRLRVGLAEAGKAIKREDLRKQLARMSELLAQYSGNFEKVVETRRGRERLVKERLNVIGAQMRKNLTEMITVSMANREMGPAAYAGVAQESLMLARLNVSRYLNSGAKGDLEMAREKIDFFIQSAEELSLKLNHPRLQTLADESAELAAEFKAQFDAVAALTDEYQRLVRVAMPAEAEEFGTLAAAVRDNQGARLAALETGTAASIGSSGTMALALSLGALALGALMALLIARGIVGPVRSMTAAMARLADGDKTVEIPALGKADEIGEMAQAVQVFKDNAIRVERLQAEQEDSKRKSDEERRAAMLALADRFEAGVKDVVEGVSSMATEMQSTAEAMSSTAEHTSRQSTVVAAAAEQASTNVQTVASAAEELSASISEIGRQVAQSSRISEGAVDEAKQTDAMVRGLAEAAGRIGEVVDLINDIASQTNLLALNATIEAARAGDAGKGFAVVAGEVKHLANQTAKATEEIAAQIDGVQSATKNAVSAIERIGGTIAQISQIAAAIAAAVEQQGAATQEIARNVHEAATGTQHVTGNISGVTAAAGETGQAAAQVLQTAGDLSRQSDLLHRQMNEFLTMIRAA